MVGLKRKLIALAIALVLSTGALAQPQKDGKKPPKDPPKVVVQPKEKPPPQNSNNKGDKGKGEKKGKP